MQTKKFYILLVTLLVVLGLTNCSSKKSELKNKPSIDISLKEDANEAYVLVRGAHLFKDTSFVSEKIALIDFGNKINIQQSNNNWVIAFYVVNSDTVKGFMHKSQLTGNANVINVIRITGLLPRRTLCTSLTASGEVSFKPLGYHTQMRVSAKNDSITLIRPLSQPGDAVWIENDDVLKHVKDTTFTQLGVTGEISPLEARNLYCLTHKMDLRPFGEALAEIIADSGRSMPGIMAFRTHAGILSKPVDATWVLDGEALAVIDSVKGLILLEVDPLRGAYPIGTFKYSGETPICLVNLSDGLVVGWQGEKNRIRSYTFNGRILEESTVSETKYQPASLANIFNTILIGTKEGNLLWFFFHSETVDTPRVFVDKKVVDGPILQVEVKNDGDSEFDDDVFLACGNSGLHILQLSSKTINKKSALNLNINRIFMIDKDILLADNQKGLHWLSLNNLKKSKSISDFREISVNDFVQNLPPVKTGLLLRGDLEPKNVDYFVLSYGDSIHVFKGNEMDKLSHSNSMNVPGRRLIWGVDILAVLSSKEVWFISLSEILPIGYSKNVFAIKNEDIRATATGIELYNGTLIGTYIDTRIDFLVELEKNFQKKPLNNRFTIIKSDSKTLILGWTFTKKGKTVALSFGSQISIGKGGATILGQHFEKGDIIELTETCQPVLVGRWPGSTLTIQKPEIVMTQ